VVAGMGGLMLCFMFAQILHEVAGLPQWGSYGIVAGVFLVIGAILVALGVQKVKTVHPLHNETTEALKENVQWIMKPK
jgi:Na+/melibiose symporter-like transporter